MNPLRIVTFVNGAYVPVAHNWLFALRRLGLQSSALVVTLDEAARTAIESCGVATVHRPLDSRAVDDLWLHRAAAVADLLADGSDVIHSDVDAVWLRDPLPLLREGGDHMVFSQGTLWPPESHARRRFVLCCGLFYLRATPDVRRFAAEFRERTAQLGDDQWALNQLIDEKVSSWAIDQPYALPLLETTFVCSRTPMCASLDGLRISVLPHHLVPRLVNGLDDVVVAHPLADKTLEATRVVLVEKGLWFLP